MARIVEAIGHYQAGAVSCLEAVELLGMSERHFRRLRDRYEEDGPERIIDRRRGPAHANLGYSVVLEARWRVRDGAMLRPGQPRGRGS